MSARTDYFEIYGYDKELITMYSRVLKVSSKLVRSDIINYEVVVAGCQVLS